MNRRPYSMTLILPTGVCEHQAFNYIEPEYLFGDNIQDSQIAPNNPPTGMIEIDNSPSIQGPKS